MVSQVRHNVLAFGGSCVVTFVVALSVSAATLTTASATRSARSDVPDMSSAGTESSPTTASVGEATTIDDASTPTTPTTVVSENLGSKGAVTSTTPTVALAKSVATTRPPTATGEPRDTKTTCIYTRHDMRAMARFAKQVGRPFSCALVYNNAAPGWKDWAKPWFVVHGDPNFNWAQWTVAEPGRTLIISQSLIPTGAPRDWRQRGAAGEFDVHIRALSGSLVDAGLGNAVIRLAFEANGPWMIDSLGKTSAERESWRMYWRRFVKVVREIPGANFEFDWTVNAGYQALALDSYYPGDDVVDIIGVDAYDSSVRRDSYASPQQRWDRIAQQPGGLLEVLAFAKQHGKPLSIPEWGLAAVGAPMYGAGDNARYVDGIAEVVRTNRVRYHSYFLSPTGGIRMTFDNAPRSLAAYRRHFGANGDSVR